MYYPRQKRLFCGYLSEKKRVCFLGVFSQIIHPTSDPTASSTKSSTLNSTRPSNGSPAKATDSWERLGSVEISEMEALKYSSWIH